MDRAAVSPAHDLLNATVDIVAAFVGHNALPHGDLAALIGEVHGALTRLGQPVAPPEPTYAPAVPIRRSITPDHLVSLIDGKSYRTLKRHLNTHGLTPHEYRARYGLPSDYPMMAASYVALRSELARSTGLGQQRRGGAAREAPVAEQFEAVTPAPKKRGRPARRAAAE